MGLVLGVTGGLVGPVIAPMTKSNRTGNSKNLYMLLMLPRPRMPLHLYTKDKAKGSVVSSRLPWQSSQVFYNWNPKQVPQIHLLLETRASTKSAQERYSIGIFILETHNSFRRKRKDNPRRNFGAFFSALRLTQITCISLHSPVDITIKAYATST